ncbi:MAG: hypothetical protein RR550_00050 [Rikenellaceae bacterium]
MIKIYETINDARLVTSVEVDGVSRSISFVGGAVVPVWKAAVFQCADAVLQRAIEGSPAFGVSYRLRKAVVAAKPVKELQNVAEVTTKQSAIEWLRIHFDTRFSVATNPDLLVQMAAEKGYVFLNWKRDGR